MITGETASQKDQRNCPEVSGKVSVHVTLEKELLLLSICSSVWLFVTPRTAARQASLSFTNTQSLLKLMSTKAVTTSNHLVLCRPLLLLPSILHSIRILSNESVLHNRWPKYWSFSISPSNEYFGLFSLTIDCLITLQSRKCQEFSPTLQLKNINFLVLRFFYGPTLTSIHDYWKNDSFD